MPVSPGPTLFLPQATPLIPVDHNDGFLKGHGTLDVDGEVIATVCRVVERINKLVYVRTLRVRYKPEVGDIVVGRVIERRRTVEDELNMQVVSEENNFICAEVRGLLLGEISNTLVCSLFPMFMTNLMRGNS